jgi:hypothetical protein
MKLPSTCLILRFALPLVVLCFAPVGGFADVLEAISNEDVKRLLLEKPQLTSLCLRNCPELTVLPPLPKLLTYLRVIDCPLLTGLPQLPSALAELEISGCAGLTALPEMPNSLAKLKIKNCASLTSLPQLPSALTTLEVANCAVLQSLPQLPPHLSSVDLHDCPFMSEHEPSPSIAISKKHGCFIREVRVEPDHFEWEGHKVVVGEAWLESGHYIPRPDENTNVNWVPDNFLIFKTRGEPLGVGKRKALALMYDHQFKGDASDLEGRLVKKNLKSFSEVDQFNPFVFLCPSVYLMRIDQSSIKDIKIRVGTYDSKAASGTGPVMSDTVLTFHVDPQI